MDTQTNVPAWYRAAVTIRNRIQRGSYKASQLIPSEAELAREFGLSRTTIRRSLDELVRQGLLQAKQGRGTFVSANADPQPVMCSGYLEDLLSLFTGTEQGRVDRRAVAPSVDIATALRVDRSEKVNRIERLRLISGKPYNVTLNYLPQRIGRKIDIADFGRLRLIEILQKRLGLVLAEATETIGATVADPAMANKLKVEAGFPLLRLRLIYYGEQAVPLALTDLFFRGDMYEHKIKLTGMIR